MHLKNMFLAVSFFALFLTVKAQSLTKSQQDSLMIIWKDISQPDTIRLNAVYKIALEGYRLKNPDSAFYYGQLQYDFARSVDNKESIIEALNVQGDSYLIMGKPDKAHNILIKALSITEEVSDKKMKLKTLGNISRVFKVKGDVEKFLEYNLQMLKISEDLKYKEGIAKSLANIGQIYKEKGDLELGLEYYNRARKIFEELESFYSLSVIRSMTAKIYLEQGYLEEAINLQQQNLAYFEKTKNKTLVATAFSNLGDIYSAQGNNKKALENFEKALEYFEEMGSVFYMAGVSQNVGKIYQREGDLKLSLEYFNRGLKLSEEMKDKKNIAKAKDAIGAVFTEQQNYIKAISNGREAISLYQEMGDVLGIRDASKNLVNSYRANGDYKSALEMNELYFKMRDSLNSVDNQKAIIENKVQSDYNKQKALDDLENEKNIAIEEAKSSALRKISWAVGGGLLMISILAFVIFNRLKITRHQKAIIEEQKKKVEQSEKYKEQFLANMSHEIRTPMHAISGMIKILERNEHPPSQDVYLNAMKTSSDNLVVILNDVLDLSKIEAGKLEIENIPMNPRLVIESVNQILKYKAEEKGLKLTYTVDNDTPFLVMGDPTRLNQVLVNLVGNAIKFTEKGGVEILLEVKNERLQFQVNDTGVGIPKKEQNSIFGAFEQAKDSTARHFGGTGLGLSISKQLVELQEGKIWLESTEGVGSTFYVELPLTIAKHDAVGADLISEEKLKAMTAALEGIRILIAEDNPFNQMIAKDDLSYYINDITIKTVENGNLAEEEFNATDYDLILMDVQMPEMNGFEATKKIREFEKQKGKTTSIPIIAMTASLLKTEIDNCYDAGMDNYIPKPYILEELIGPIFKELRA